MRPRLSRQRLLLFALLWCGHLLTLLVVGGPGALSARGVLIAAGSALLITLAWDFVVFRPISRGLGRLETRMRSLTAGSTDAPAGTADSHAADPVQLDRVLAGRQRKLAGYTRRLRREIERLRAIYEHSHDAVLLFEPAGGRLVDCNPRAAEMLGIDRQAVQPVHLADLYAADAAYLRGLVEDVMTANRGRSIRIEYRGRDGRAIPAEVSFSNIHLDNGNLLLCVARDISERESAAQRIAHMAYHDSLTGLPNRTLLTDRVNHALARARRTGQNGALLFLDLDRFKRINDSLGHSVGDELLTELARRLRSSLREEDTIARLGGDEFVVLLEGLGQRQDRAVEKAREIAEKLRGVFADAYHLGGHALFVTASIGVVTFPLDGDSVDTLLRHADTAMYHAKGDGRDGTRIFERRMDEAAMSRLRLEQELHTGLVEGQFELYFQPILVIRDGRILGAEVLLRWRHPQNGLIAPAEFLRYVESCTLMQRLDEWVLRETCRLLGELQRARDLPLPEYLSVNVSNLQFHQPDLVERIEAILAETGADGRRLQFEITETLLLKNADESVERMYALRQLGIRFAIDDFGTGHSSLADLRQLPIDTLKIDEGFVRDVAQDANDAAIVRAILSMAQHIGLGVVAEGVETREQLQYLRDIGCSHYQGFLGRPPLAMTAFCEELRYCADLHMPTGQPPTAPGPRETAPALSGETLV